MGRRLIGLMRKEFVQFFRDTALVLLVFYMFVEIALCGISLTLEVRNVATAVYDADRSNQSQDLIDAFDRLQNFTVGKQVTDPTQIDELMDSGEVQLGLIIPPSFSRDIASGQTAEIQLLFGGSNSIITKQAMADASSLLRDYNTKIAWERVGQSGLSGHSFLPQVNNQVRIWYIPNLKYVYFVMLTMLAISVVVLGILLPAASIVREKEAGTFEQLMVTPVSAAELITAKLLPMIAIKLVGLTIGIALSLWVFDVPLRGSVLLFYGISLVMFLSSMGIGVMLGVFAQNMQQTLLLGFFIFFPMAFLSGTVVPINNMPQALQWLTYISPLRYYVDVTLGVFLKGVGLDVLWPQTVALAALGMIFLSTSVFQLRRSLA
ncbi:MAG: ABC transporter permease [Ardenticatenaceae bacterium]|nr:ABC transporter permease [Anaerolineales bacterium]MCB8973785.1 ABC transporter permease [Ardenticatenaceae bacterium]